MVKVVPKKKCHGCNTTFLSYSTKPKCQKCVKNVCCYSHKGRCNVTFNCIDSCAGKFCLTHFKQLQNECFICQIPRPENDMTFMSNYMWYCPNHAHIYKNSVQQYALESLQDYLNSDVVGKIVDYMCAPVTCRYPESFNLKSLKES